MQETGLRIKLKAMFDKQQVQKETKEVVDEAQKTLDKKELKLKIEDNLKELKKKLEETRVAYQNLLNQPMNWTTNRQLEALEDQMEDLRNAIKEDEKALGDLGVSSDKLGGKLWSLAGKFSALAIAGKVLSTLKDKFNEFQLSQKELVMATWATWEALQELTNSVLNVQGEVAQSQNEIAEAVGELNTRLGLTGEELEDFTTKYLKFASVTGQDGKTAIADNVKMFNIWGVSIDKQAEYLDKLTVAGQQTGISVAELTNQLQQNAPVLQEMGLSLDDSIALLSNFEQAWVEASQVLASMKIGLKSFAEQGLDPMEALQYVIDGVKDGTISLSDTMEIFGARGWTAMYTAIKNGTFALDEMKGKLSDVNGAVEDTYNEMETLGEFVSRKVNKARAEFVQWNNEGFQATRKLYHVIKDELQPSVEKATTWFGNWKKAIEGVITGEREFAIVDGQLVSRLTEEGLQLEKNRIVMQKYNDSWNEAREAKAKFDATKVDDTKTREEFEKDKQKALETMEAFRKVLIAKEKYFDQTSNLSWAKTFKDNSMLRSLQADILRTRLAKFTEKPAWNNNNDGWTVGDLLLGGGWGWGGWKGKSKAEEMLEAFNEELVDTRDNLDSFVNEHQKTYDDLVKQIQKVESEYGKLQGKADDMRHSLEKSVRSYNEQLEKNQTDSLEKLGQRYVELKEKRAEIDNDYLKRVVGEISDTEWKNIRDDGWTFRGYTYSELKDIKELYDEIKVIEENTTEEQRKSSEFTEKTSRAQEILNSMKEKEAELEQKKADAIEKQQIATAVMNQTMWKEFVQTMTKNGEEIGTYYYDVENKKWEQIHNVDNIEYAKQLEQQFKELSNQKQQLETAKDDEVEILTTATSQKIQLEQQYEKVYQASIDKQKKGLDELIAKTQTLIDKRREYLSMWGELHNAYGGSVLSGKVSVVGENWPEQIIARQSSYVQPRNAGNSYNTVNNNGNTLSINGIEVKYDNMDDMLNALKEKLTYRS